VTVGNRKFASTSDAVGARVTVWTSVGRQIREVQGGMGFASQSDHAIHVGIPRSQTVQRITIRWPSGRIREFGSSEVGSMLDRHIRIVEGSAELSTN
jgi:hypothetical protein